MLAMHSELSRTTSELPTGASFSAHPYHAEVYRSLSMNPEIPAETYRPSELLTGLAFPPSSPAELHRSLSSSLQSYSGFQRRGPFSYEDRQFSDDRLLSPGSFSPLNPPPLFLPDAGGLYRFLPSVYDDLRGAPNPSSPLQSPPIQYFASVQNSPVHSPSVQYFPSFQSPSVRSPSLQHMASVQPSDAAHFASDEFRMFEFKVRKCAHGKCHEWTECPYAHPGEKARRRDPRRYAYSGTICPDFRKGSCRKGDSCEFAHGVFECWLHPSRYRTQPCKDGLLCKRKICFFAHHEGQLRLPKSAMNAKAAMLAAAGTGAETGVGVSTGTGSGAGIGECSDTGAGMSMNVSMAMNTPSGIEPGPSSCGGRSSSAASLPVVSEEEDFSTAEFRTEFGSDVTEFGWARTGSDSTELGPVVTGPIEIGGFAKESFCGSAPESIARSLWRKESESEKEREREKQRDREGCSVQLSLEDRIALFNQQASPVAAHGGFALGSRSLSLSLPPHASSPASSSPVARGASRVAFQEVSTLSPTSQPYYPTERSNVMETRYYPTFGEPPDSYNMYVRDGYLPPTLLGRSPNRFPEPATGSIFSLSPSVSQHGPLEFSPGVLLSPSPSSSSSSRQMPRQQFPFNTSSVSVQSPSSLSLPSAFSSPLSSPSVAASSYSSIREGFYRTDELNQRLSGARRLQMQSEGMPMPRQQYPGQDVRVQQQLMQAQEIPRQHPTCEKSAIPERPRQHYPGRETRGPGFAGQPIPDQELPRQYDPGFPSYQQRRPAVGRQATTDGSGFPSYNTNIQQRSPLGSHPSRLSPNLDPNLDPGRNVAQGLNPTLEPFLVRQGRVHELSHHEEYLMLLPRQLSEPQGKSEPQYANLERFRSLPVETGGQSAAALEFGRSGLGSFRGPSLGVPPPAPEAPPWGLSPSKGGPPRGFRVWEGESRNAGGDPVRFEEVDSASGESAESPVCAEGQVGPGHLEATMGHFYSRSSYGSELVAHLGERGGSLSSNASDLISELNALSLQTSETIHERESERERGREDENKNEKGRSKNNSRQNAAVPLVECQADVEGGGGRGGGGERQWGEQGDSTAITSRPSLSQARPYYFPPPAYPRAISEPVSGQEQYGSEPENSAWFGDSGVSVSGVSDGTRQRVALPQHATRLETLGPGSGEAESKFANFGPGAGMGRVPSGGARERFGRAESEPGRPHHTVGNHYFSQVLYENEALEFVGADLID